MSKEMATFFDSLAPDWDNAPLKYEVREKLTALMDLPPNSVIADAGCGKGVMFEHLLKTKPAKIIAIDVSGEMIRLAKESFNDECVEYINGDLYTVALPILDAVIFFNSYPHFIDKIKLANKLADVIKKGGLLIIAHSLSKEEINGCHTGKNVSTLSVPLENAEIEADKFNEYFLLDSYIDNEEMYFVRLIRRSQYV